MPLPVVRVWLFAAEAIHGEVQALHGTVRAQILAEGYNLKSRSSNIAVLTRYMSCVYNPGTVRVRSA